MSSANKTATAANPPAPRQGSDAHERWGWLTRWSYRSAGLIGAGLVVGVIYWNIKVTFFLAPLYPLLGEVGSVVSCGRLLADDAAFGGDDSVGMWTALLGWCVVSLLAAALWTVIAGPRVTPRRAGAVLFHLARFGVVITLLEYGFDKVVPTQMGYMRLPHNLISLAGDQSQMTTLWGFMAASTPYTVVCGVIEVVAGVLLLWRRTWLLGAVLAVVALTQVFVLNLCYDVPVKLVSGTLLVSAIALTKPYWANIASVVRNRAAEVSPVAIGPTWSDTRRQRRVVASISAGAIVLAVVLAVHALISSLATWRDINTVASRIDGMWELTTTTTDGRPRAVDAQSWALIGVTDRSGGWTGLSTATTNGAVTPWYVTISGDDLTVRQHQEQQPTKIAYRLSDSDTLTLTTNLDGHRVANTYQRRTAVDRRPGIHLIAPDRSDTPNPRISEPPA